jgi:fatty acid desaturase
MKDFSHVSGEAKRGRGRFSVEWPTLLLILACYILWAGAGFIFWPGHPVLAMAAVAFAVAMQSSLSHEVAHGHPTRFAGVNEALIFLPIGLVWPYRRFKSLHLRHHADERLTDPFDDPESYYHALWRHRDLPVAMKFLLRINNTMLGRLFLGPWLSACALFASDFRLVRDGDRAVRRAWIHHCLGLLAIVPVITLGFGMSLWLYILVPCWLGQSLISIRTFAEHQWSESPEGRTVIIERSPLSFLFLNNNLHFVHHRNPTVAWYRLPALFRARREEWLAMNNGYYFPNYLSLFRQFALRAKEPVVHPFLRREPEPGRAFRPRVRSRNVAGLGTAPVPAEPPKE